MLSDLRCRVGKLLWPRVEGFSKLRECPKCMLGGIRSFASAGVSPLRLSRAPELLAPDKALLYAHSAACTITRMEADEDLETPMFREVHARLAQERHRPIKRRGLGLREKGWRALSVSMVEWKRPEPSVRRRAMPGCRSWCGADLVRRWLAFDPERELYWVVGNRPHESRISGHPLTGMQAGRAAHHIASRFLRRNATEWRQYNPDAVDGAWPTATNDRRFLLVPSSRNELYGHPDWQVGWRSPTEGLTR